MVGFAINILSVLVKRNICFLSFLEEILSIYQHSSQRLSCNDKYWVFLLETHKTDISFKDLGWARTIFLRELMRVHKRQWSALFAVIMVSLISTTLFFIISNKTHFYEWIRNKMIICISFTTIFEIWVEKIWFVYFYDTCSVKAILPAKYCCYVSSLYKHCRLFLWRITNDDCMDCKNVNCSMISFCWNWRQIYDVKSKTPACYFHFM